MGGEERGGQRDNVLDEEKEEESPHKKKRGVKKRKGGGWDESGFMKRYNIKKSTAQEKMVRTPNVIEYGSCLSSASEDWSQTSIKRDNWPSRQARGENHASQNTNNK
ncbi:hypothetical protein BgiBS90_016002 [Biomphalaria glabrata]|nr:hypothetical protein BgiBS90_016002 [Biomphalaria glabrata]